MEVCADRVKAYYPLDGELPFTEWLAEDILIEERRCEDGSTELVFRLAEHCR